MKSVKSVVRIGALVALGGMYHGSAVAATADGSAAAQIVAPVAISETTPMNFGSILPASAAVTTVTLDAAGTRSSDQGAASLVGGGTVAAGVFTITQGEANKVVDISVADGTTDLVNGATTLTFTSPTVSAATMTLVGGGVDTFTVGGTLSIPVGAAPGTYISAAAYTVTVNYQ